MATNTRLTYADYEAFPDDGNRYEIINGEVSVTAAPSVTHQRAVTCLARFLDEHVEAHSLGEMYASPLAVVLSPSDVFEPDVGFISRARSAMIDARGVMRGEPDLCIEVPSPSTRERDHSVKFERYARFGVTEYWIVDPDTEAVAVFALEGSAYALVAAAHGDLRITSRILPNLALRAAVLFASRW